MTQAMITGATGFIGSHLVEALVEGGADVTCLHRAASDTSMLRQLSARCIQADVTDPAALSAAVRGVEVVFHVAGATHALRASDYHRVNAEGTRSLLAACAAMESPPVVVVVSSIAAAGPAATRPLVESDPARPVSHYGRSKRAAELAAHTFADRLPITVVRPAIVFGPRDSALLSIFRPIRRFGVHLVPGWRASQVSLVHVTDLCAAMLAAAARGRRLNGAASHEPMDEGYYFVADGDQPTYNALGRRMAQAMSRRAVCVRAPLPVAWAAGLAADIVARCRRRPRMFSLDKIREAAAGNWICSPSRAIEQLGWSCGKSLDARLGETAAWYRANGWL